MSDAVMMSGTAHMVAESERITNQHGVSWTAYTTRCGKSGDASGRLIHPSEVYRAQWCPTCRPAGR